MNIIYTVLDNVNLKEGCITRSYKCLDANWQKWIDGKTMELLKKRTFPELKLSSILKDSKFKVEEQPFFMIDQKGYFLDFFIPELNIAIELNGDSHRSREAHNHDMYRDYIFRNIGIQTIRITNCEVYQDDFKVKMNVYVNACINGDYDGFKYYETPNCVKFDGKLTPYQTFFTKLDEILRQCENNKKVLLKTSETYIMYALYHMCELSNDAANRTFIENIAKTIQDKQLDFYVVYTGSRKNLQWTYSEISRKTFNAAKGITFDIVLEGREIYDCRAKGCRKPNKKENSIKTGEPLRTLPKPV